jgi:Secretion system C-terminal sorting domain
MPVITSSLANPCVGSPVIYSVPNQNNVTFAWHFPGGVILTGNSVSYSWLNSTGSVYVVATNSAGCSIQSTVYTPTIYSSYCCAAPNIFVTGPQLIQTSQQVFGGSPPQNSIIQVDPGIKLVINTSCTFDNCVIYMRSKSSIEVQNKLTITNNSFLTNCEDFWNGIVISNGATLVMNQNSRIQDAENAITVLTGGKYDISTAIFNRNYKGIVWQQNASSNNSTIYNSIFTSRDIPNNTSVTVLKTNNLLAGLPFQNLRYPFASPNNYTRGVVGIEANFVDNLGPVTTPHFELRIGEPVQGSSMANVFDNLDYGIWVNRSNVLIQNNIFQNLRGYNAGNIQNNSGTGILAYGNNSVQLQENCIQIGGYTTSPSNYQKNIFNNCGSAVEVYSYNSINAIGNLISNTNNTLANSQTVAWVGRLGIKVASRYKSNLFLASNNITNCLDGINWSHTNYGQRFYATILLNVIASTANGSCINGIAGTFGITGSAPESSPVVIESNAISTAINGINLKGAKTYGIERFSVWKNTIILKSNTSVTKGISSVNADNVWIHDNTITSSSRNYPAAHGIFIQNSPNSTFECNSISTLGSCMVFSGNCVNPLGKGCLFNNTFSNAKNGIEVFSGGNIGTQGASFVPSDNKWASAAGAFSGKQILNSGQLINYNNRVVNPNGINGYTMILNNFSGVTPLQTSGISGKVCYSNDQLEIVSTLTEAEDALIDEVIGNSQSSNLLPENIYTNKKYAMDMLLHDSLLSGTSDSLLLEFLDSVKLETVYDLELVDELVLDNDYPAAQSLNSSLTSTFLMEQNQLIINDWNLRLLDNPNCMSDTAIFTNFLLALTPIANQCAYFGGEAVISARALLYCYTNDYFEYDDDCESSSISNRIAHTIKETRNLNITNEILTVAPNPTSGIIKLDYNVNSDAEMLVFNSNGLICKRIYLKATKNQELVNLEHLNSGSYIYKVKFANGEQIVGKINVAK